MNPPNSTPTSSEAAKAAQPYQATPREELLRQLLDSNVPKNEREWCAANEILRLRANEEINAKLAQAIFHTTPATADERLRRLAEKVCRDESEAELEVLLAHACFRSFRNAIEEGDVVWYSHRARIGKGYTLKEALKGSMRRGAVDNTRSTVPAPPDPCASELADALEKCETALQLSGGILASDHWPQINAAEDAVKSALTRYRQRSSPSEGGGT